MVLNYQAMVRPVFSEFFSDSDVEPWKVKNSNKEPVVFSVRFHQHQAVLRPGEDE